MAHYGCGSSVNNIMETIRKMVDVMVLAGGRGDGAVSMTIGILIELLGRMSKDQLDVESAVHNLRDIRGTVGRFACDVHGIGGQLDVTIRKLEQELLIYKDDVWEKIFGHCWYLRDDFSRYHFGKEQDSGDTAEEFDFGRPMTGLEAMTEFEKMGRHPASIWAQGRYINLHPEACRHSRLAGIGARRETSDHGDLFPTYYMNGPGIEVKLYSIHVPLDNKIFRFLVRKAV